MPAKAKDRSARKQTPQCQCQEQIKDILTRLKVLEANRPKITAVIQPVNGERFADLKVLDFPPNPERERLVNKMQRELIAHEIAREIDRQLPRKRRKLSKR